MLGLNSDVSWMDSPTPGAKVKIMGIEIEFHQLSQIHYLFYTQKPFKLDKNSRKADCFAKTRRDSLRERTKN